MTQPAVDIRAEDDSLTRFVAADDVAELCVLVVNYNTAHLLERCIVSVPATHLSHIRRS